MQRFQFTIASPVPISDKNFRFRLNFQQKSHSLISTVNRPTIARNPSQSSAKFRISSSDSQISTSDR